MSEPPDGAPEATAAAVAVSAIASLTAGDVVVADPSDLGAYAGCGLEAADIARVLHLGETRHGDSRRQEGAIRPLLIPASCRRGANVPVAAGAALALAQRRAGGAVLTFVDARWLSEGDVHEALNLSAVLCLPLLLLADWPWIIPNAAGRSTPGIESFCAGYGMPGRRVDGEDLVGVYFALTEAAGFARLGGGPTLIATIRQDSKAEDGVARLSRFLIDEDIMDQEEQMGCSRHVDADIGAAAELMRSPLASHPAPPAYSDAGTGALR